MKYKIITQPDSEACGPACIKMAADYLGKEQSFSEIARITGYKKRQGLSNKELEKSLKKLGFAVQSKANASWADLRRYNKKDSAIIVSWMLDGYIGHFSLVDNITETHISLADPQIGKIRKLRKLVFMRLWLDYDNLWFPKKSSDIQLRWMVVISK